MQAGILVLFLLATSASKAFDEESDSPLRVAKDFDVFEEEAEVSIEEPNKRSLYNWLAKAPTEYDTTIVEQEVLEVEVPVKEEVMVKVPIAPVEVPLPNRPYSVELRLLVPEITKNPIKFQAPSLELPALHYSHGNKPFGTFSTKQYSHFAQPLKTEVFETSPIVTEFASIKAPVETLIVEEDIYEPEVHSYGKLENSFKSFYPTKSFSHLPHLAKTEIVESHPIVTEFASVKAPVETLIVEEDIYEPEVHSYGKLEYPFKSFFPSKSFGHFPHLAKAEILESHPIVTEFASVKAPVETVIVEEDIYEPEFHSYGKLEYPFKNFFPSKSFSHFPHLAKTEIVESHPIVTEITAVKAPVETRIVEEDIYVPEIHSYGNLGYPYKSFYPSKPFSHFPHPVKTEIIGSSPIFSEFSTFKAPVETIVEEDIYVPDYHSYGKLGFSPSKSFSHFPHLAKTEIVESSPIVTEFSAFKAPVETHIVEDIYAPEVHSYGKLGYPYKGFFPSKSFSHFPHPVKTEIIEARPFVTEFTAIKAPVETHLVEEDIIVPEVHSYGKLSYPYNNLFAERNPAKVVVEESLSYLPYEQEKIFKTHPSSFFHTKHLPTLVEEPIASFDWTRTPHEKERFFKKHPSTFITQSLPTRVSEPVVLTNKANPFAKHYAGKTRIGSFGTRSY